MGPDDAFRGSCAGAVVERELGIRAGTLRVDDGVLTLRVRMLEDATRVRLPAALAAIGSLRRIRILGPCEMPPPETDLAVGPRESGWDPPAAHASRRVRVTFEEQPFPLGP